MSDVYFTDVSVKGLEAEKTLPFKFTRLLEKTNLAQLVKGKKICIKMHFGGNVGFTTIHPVFVRFLVQFLKKSGAKSVFIADGSARGAELRGYTRKSLGASPKSLFTGPWSITKVPIGFKKLDEAELSKKVLKSDILIVLSHVKGHGDCGFGGAGKNIAMGCTPGHTRGKMHALEGGIEWDAAKCTHCNKCIQECPNKANKFNKDNKFEIFYHNCKFCRHCILACTNHALSTQGQTFADFQRGMALVIKNVLDGINNKAFYINFLTNITVFCDCWGFSTPSLVPDIGILASSDIVAIDRASLDMIKVENFLPIGLPDGRSLGEGKHLFEKIHGKDPYLITEFLSEMGKGNKDYTIHPSD